MFQHIFKIFLLTPHEKSPKIPNFSIKIKQKPQCLNKTFITLAITLGKATSLTRKKEIDIVSLTLASNESNALDRN